MTDKEMPKVAQKVYLPWPFTGKTLNLYDAQVAISKQLEPTLTSITAESSKVWPVVSEPTKQRSRRS